MNNIEKSAFRRGEYVGYGGGQVWRIVKHSQWYAYPRNNPAKFLTCARLADLQQQLAAL